MENGKEKFVLEVKKLSKVISDVHILDDISFSVNYGDVLSIIGPSGSGKTTMLRILTQLDVQTSGDIIIDGEMMHQKKETDKRILLKTGLVFQNFNLFPHFTAIENIATPLIEVLKKTKKEACYDAMLLLERVKLQDKAQSYPCQLSGGQQQRVAIARALALKPMILFFDEPTSALDPEMIGGIMELLKELSNGDITLIIVTHELNFARNISSKILFLDNGNLLCYGTVEDVIGNNKNERVNRFINSLIF